MKIHHWINKYNAKIAHQIIWRYSAGLSSGRQASYGLHPVFWGYYLLRMLALVVSVISFKKEAYATFYRTVFSRRSVFYAPDQHTLLYIKIRDLMANMFGFRYFVPVGTRALRSTLEMQRVGIRFTRPITPMISVVVWGNYQLAYVFNCLESLERVFSKNYPFEVIILDDAHTADREAFFLQVVSGVTYVAVDSRGGRLSRKLFNSIKHAKAPLICFLDGRVQVSENWLEPLIHTLRQEEICCVASKICNWNGLLEHAGGIIFSDQSKGIFGKHMDPAHPYYNYNREVDYCSDLSLMLRKKDLSALLGNQEQVVAGLRMGNDVCDILRGGLGRRIMYQPASVVVHCKDFSKDNEHYATSDQLPTETRRRQRIIIFIDDAMPTPDQDSGSNRLFRIMKLVKSMGYHVVFMPNDGDRKGRYFTQMVQEGFEVLYRFPNRQGMIDILSHILPFARVVWICKPQNNMLFQSIFQANKNCAWIYDTIDLHFLRLQREGQLTANESTLKAAAKIKQTELSIARRADVTIAITEDEKEMLLNESIGKVVVIPNVHAVKGSDEEFPGFAERNGLLFIGSYIHKPNIDAVVWLVDQIMPEVWKRDPDITLTLLGSNPPEKLLALESDRVFVPGYIKDVSMYFNQSRVFVAPLRFGAGMKGKIGQSLEYGLPIVSTYIGVEGMNLSDCKHVLIAETAAEMASQIIRLYHSPELWNSIHSNSMEAVRAFSPESVSKKLAQLFEDLHVRDQIH